MLPFLLVPLGFHRVAKWPDFLDEASGRVLGPGFGFHQGVDVAWIDTETRFAVERDIRELHDEFPELIADQLPESLHGHLGIFSGNLENLDNRIRQVRIVGGGEYAGSQQFNGFHANKFINYGHGRQVYHTR